MTWPDPRQTAERSTFFTDEFWANLNPNRNLLSEITDDLCMGGGPFRRLCLPGAFVAVLDIKPSTSPIYWDDTEIRYVNMHDDWNQKLDGVDELAQWVNERRAKEWKGSKVENRVLVKCAAGLNRSGVVVARALMLGPEQLSAREAIDLIREKRDPFCLCNRMFEEWLLTHDRRAER